MPRPPLSGIVPALLLAGCSAVFSGCNQTEPELTPKEPAVSAAEQQWLDSAPPEAQVTVIKRLSSMNGILKHRLQSAYSYRDPASGWSITFRKKIYGDAKKFFLQPKKKNEGLNRAVAVIDNPDDAELSSALFQYTQVNLFTKEYTAANLAHHFTSRIVDVGNYTNEEKSEIKSVILALALTKVDKATDLHSQILLDLLKNKPDEAHANLSALSVEMLKLGGAFYERLEQWERENPRKEPGMGVTP